MKTVKLPDEMVSEIKQHIVANPSYGYESIAEFVRSAVRRRLLECLPAKERAK